MTLTTTDLLLEASGVSKTYGAVVALRSASLAVRPGEIHALMGANGAGKSTLVKILTGAVAPDAGTISVRGKARTVQSPAEARRGGLISVYQEPSLIPDLDIRQNLRLTETPLDPFRHWLDELGLGGLDLAGHARRLPLATLRIIDLARALASEPDVLMLDEMTAALPANLTERVLEVVARQRGTDRSIIFISHRMIEIAAVCDRATVLREGATVGVVDVTKGSEDKIVELMLGEIIKDMTAADHGTGTAARSSDTKPRIAARGLTARSNLNDVTFDLYPGEVLGVVALEGQGQDELFDILAGSARPASGQLLVDDHAVSFRHPADAIRAGLVYVAADRAEALLMQRSIRENIALPMVAALRDWGLIDLGGERRMVDDAVGRLQIDARAAGEVRRLSGGNQQKVTIARWVAGGVRTMLCFDPTRGIDIGTKQQIYVLLRDLAEAGAAVLIYTSELKEVQLVCDRAIVMFGGEIVAELAGADADEASLLRAAYNLRADAELPEDAVGAAIEESTPPDSDDPTACDRSMSAAAAPIEGAGSRQADAIAAWARRNAWMLSLLALLVGLLVFTKLIQPSYGPIPVQGLGTSVLPLALAAVAQAVIVISGGIDLSIGSMMALTSVVAASLMENQSDATGIVVVVGVLGFGLVLGGINGAVVVGTRVPDIVVTLAMSFVWAGFALLVRSSPGGGAASWLTGLAVGPLGNEWIPRAAVVLLVVVSVIWFPLVRSRLGLSMYAIGSNRLAAFRSGVPVGRTKLLAYAITGLFAALGGLSLTASTGIGTPVPGPYTLLSVAAVVLGGVSLAGGRGGVFGPIVGVVVLQLIQTDMSFLSLDSNLAIVAQGVILIGVVMVGSVIELRQSRR